jgi:hypothetical protein
MRGTVAKKIRKVTPSPGVYRLFKAAYKGKKGKQAQEIVRELMKDA